LHSKRAEELMLMYMHVFSGNLRYEVLYFMG